MKIKNWYKIAVEENDFYSFYAFSAIPDEVFQKNPQILYDFIDMLNSFRDYYLEYLIKQIRGELKYAMHSDRIIPEFHHNFNFSIVNQIPESKILNLIKKLDDRSQISINNNIERYEERDQHINKLSENYKHIRLLVVYAIENLKKSKNKNTGLKIAKDIFGGLEWRGSFGGELWQKITEQTLKLYEAGEVKQQKFSSTLMNKIRSIVLYLDTINSLEHNTGSVLNKMPENETNWLFYALEIIKEGNPENIASLSKNPNIQKIYQRSITPIYDQNKQKESNYELIYRSLLAEGVTPKTIQRAKPEILNVFLDILINKNKDLKIMGDTRLALIVQSLFRNSNFISNNNLMNKFLKIDHDFSEFGSEILIKYIFKSTHINVDSVKYIIKFILKTSSISNDKIYQWIETHLGSNNFLDGTIKKNVLNIAENFLVI